MLRTILALGLASTFLMAFEQATPKDPGVAALCQQIVAIVSPTPGTLVAAVDGALYDDIAQRERSGCLIMISGTWPALQREKSPIDRVFDALTAQGWTQSPNYGADGPDGTLVGLEKDGLFCLMQGRWDGGDDSDSTYVPLDVYQMTILCTRLDGKEPVSGGR
jgi:hypothetical protein